jgi:hypothetical protein
MLVLAAAGAADGRGSAVSGRVSRPRRRDHADVVASYPAPPWRLAGRVVIAGVPLPLDAARRLVPAPLRLLPVWPGRALAIVLLGLYGEGSTLCYGEVAGIIGPVLAGARPGGLVTYIAVDDERSLAGGHELWGLPKQLATVRWQSGAVEVRDPAGPPILYARWSPPRVHVPVPAAAPFIAARDGAVRRGVDPASWTRERLGRKARAGRMSRCREPERRTRRSFAARRLS